MVTSKKYEFTGETIQWFRRTLKRIRRVADNKLGGFLESEQNLSQNGSCWVDYDAKVFGSALIFGSAQVCGSAMVYDSAQVSGSALVYGEARVFDSVQVYGSAQVFDSALVYGEAQVSGKARIFGSALVCGSAQVSGMAWVFGSAQVFDSAQVYDSALVYGEARICNKDKISKPHHVRYVSNLRWPLTSVPGGIRVGCEFYTYKHWKQHHVDIGIKHGLTAKQSKLYFAIMRTIRQEQLEAKKEAKKHEQRQQKTPL